MDPSWPVSGLSTLARLPGLHQWLLGEVAGADLLSITVAGAAPGLLV